MKISELLQKNYDVVEGNFHSLSTFNFSGVYVLCENNDDVVYVGSAYSRTIKTRLEQYLRSNDSGNTLGRTIAKQIAKTKRYDKTAKQKIGESISKIKNLKIYAIKCNDLEYQLVKIAKPKFNSSGKYDR